MYKEFYKDHLPMHLQHLVPTEPIGIKDHAKIMFQQCTKYTLIYDDNPYMLYYMVMLTFRY
ncbi:hypothetical protein A4_257 [Escherichia phage A4]|nr:hypothetical protein A4_257 [Escherichia phage A4]